MCHKSRLDDVESLCAAAASHPQQKTSFPFLRTKQNLAFCISSFRLKAEFIVKVKKAAPTKTFVIRQKSWKLWSCCSFFFSSSLCCCCCCCFFLRKRPLGHAHSGKARRHSAFVLWEHIANSLNDSMDRARAGDRTAGAVNLDVVAPRLLGCDWWFWISDKAAHRAKQEKCTKDQSACVFRLCFC